MGARTGALLDLGTSRRVLESIVGATEVGLVVLDAVGRAVYMNASARRLLRADDVLPQRARRWLGPLQDRVRATGAVSVDRWTFGNVVLRARLRLLDDAPLLLLELTVAHADPHGDVVDTLAHALDMSRRDARLLTLVWRGLRNDEIGEVLGIPAGTVKSRLYRLYRKHGFKHRSGAVLAVAELLPATASPARG